MQMPDLQNYTSNFELIYLANDYSMDVVGVLALSDAG
jgi:hypothetical protein